MVTLVEEAHAAIDEVIDVTGRACIEAILEGSAAEFAGSVRRADARERSATTATKTAWCISRSASCVSAGPDFVIGARGGGGPCVPGDADARSGRANAPFGVLVLQSDGN
jgi:hypothetical protein